MSLKVGLTGGVASGKTTVIDGFAKLGINIIDADSIARDLLRRNTECYHAVLQYFGPRVLLDNADINRRWLRDKIFSEPEAKLALEAIIHPAVRQVLITESETSTSPYCILSIPLLIEAGMQTLVDRILVVDLTPEQQIERLMLRDKLDRAQAQAMLDGQSSREHRLSFADDIIDNTQMPTALDEQIETLHQYYLRLAAKHA